MQPIDVCEVQAALNRFANQDVYIHLETTNGAYASHHNEGFFPLVLISVTASSVSAAERSPETGRIASA